jgi:hypothetical protein
VPSCKAGLADAGVAVDDFHVWWADPHGGKLTVYVRWGSSFWVQREQRR